MSFAIVIILFTMLAWIAGSLLAIRYPVYALAPVACFFVVLGAAGCVVCGANLSGGVIAALSGVTGLQFGYFLRLFVPRTARQRGATSSGLTRAQQNGRRQRPFRGRDEDARRSVPRRGDS